MEHFCCVNVTVGSGTDRWLGFSRCAVAQFSRFYDYVLQQLHCCAPIGCREFATINSTIIYWLIINNILIIIRRISQSWLNAGSFDIVQCYFIWNCTTAYSYVRIGNANREKVATMVSCGIIGAVTIITRSITVYLVISMTKQRIRNEKTAPWHIKFSETPYC